jgi:hypothetical protein
MVKHIHIILDDVDFKEIIEAKGDVTWKEFLKAAARLLKK